VAALAAAIRELLDQPTQAQALGQRARARCLEQYSMSKIAQALSDAVSKALQAHGAARG
jgi:glycosyltransferase involved in cell wall biosynthesis